MRTSHVIDKASAERIIEPFRPVLASAITGAFDDWGTLLDKAPKQTAGLSRYVFARYVHDRVIFRLRTAQKNNECPGLRITKINGLQVAVLSDQIVIKLKKLDDNLRSRNIQTGQTVAFDSQQLLDPEIGRITNATGGYVINPESRHVSQVVVVCWEGDHKHWTIDLIKDEGASGVIVEVEGGPVAPPSRPRTKIVGQVDDSGTADSQ